MQLSRLLAGVLSVSLLGAVPITLAATPAGAGTAEAAVQARVVLVPQALRVHRAGQRITLRGQVQVKQADGSWGYVPPGIAGDTVRLYRRAKGEGRHPIRTLEVGAAKAIFTFHVSSRGNATYSVDYSGIENRVLAASVRRVVKGSRNPGGRGYLRKGRAHYRGDVNPGWGRRQVVIQRKTCRTCAFKRFRVVRTDRSGKYDVLVGAPRSGSWWFRSRVRATMPKYVAGLGNTIRTYERDAR